MFRATCFLLILAALAAARPSSPDSAARRARDHADLAAITALAERATQHAKTSKSAATWLEAAQLDSWVFEAASDRGQPKAAEPAVASGIAAAKSAIALDANSSAAHGWLGALQGDLISLSPAVNGMRYGSSASRELALALKLDPRNVNAWIAQGISLLYTPTMFGGSVSGAIADFQRAAALAPHNDTAHVWLAQAFARDKQWPEARRESAAALRLDPARAFTRAVVGQIAKRAAR